MFMCTYNIILATAFINLKVLIFNVWRHCSPDRLLQLLNVTYAIKQHPLVMVGWLLQLNSRNFYRHTNFDDIKWLEYITCVGPL
jgi:hypothetical protein